MTVCAIGCHFSASRFSTVTEPWLERWEEGRIGWHELDGNANLKRHWPTLERGSRVLVPLCGKAQDIVWLADHGHDVVGVELSPIAVEAFFAENALAYEQRREGEMSCYRSRDRAITIWCGDYFEFASTPFDALYDRGALVAIPAKERPRYVEHTEGLLENDAYRLIITLEYDQARAPGPPYAVMPEEVESYWDDLVLLSRHNDIDNCPPKFKAAGLTEVIEAAWSSRS